MLGPGQECDNDERGARDPGSKKHPSDVVDSAIEKVEKEGAAESAESSNRRKKRKVGADASHVSGDGMEIDEVQSAPAPADVTAAEDDAVHKTDNDLDDGGFLAIVDKPVRTLKHPSFAENLGGELAVGRALTELLTNAYDAARRCTEPDAVTIAVYAYYDDDSSIQLKMPYSNNCSGVVKLQIVITNSGEPMKFTAFREQPNRDKQNDPTATGKFGAGLNDAMAQLAYYNLSYEATSGNRVFRLLPELLEGCVCIQQDLVKESTATKGRVTTIVSWPRNEAPNNDFKAFDDPRPLCEQLDNALASCWAWLVQEERLKVRWECPLGTGVVAEWMHPDDAFRNHVFVHGKRYDTGGTAYRGFALAYNIRSTKSRIQERERLRPPNQWNEDARKLFLACAKVEDVAPEYAFSKSVRALFENYAVTRDKQVKPCWEMTNGISDKVLETIGKATQEQDLQAKRRERAEEDLRKAQRSESEAMSNLDSDDDPEHDHYVLKSRAQVRRLKEELEKTPDVPRPLPIIVKKLPAPRNDDADAAPADDESTDDALAVGMVLYKAPTREPASNGARQAMKFPLVRCEADAPDDTPQDRTVRQALARVCTTLSKMDEKKRPIHINMVNSQQDTAIIAIWYPHTRCFDVRRSVQHDHVEDRVKACFADLQRRCCPDDFVTLLAKTEIATSKNKNKNSPFQVPKQAPKWRQLFRPMLIIDDWGSSTGGIAAFNYQLAHDLARFGIEVYVLITDKKSMPPLALCPPENIVFVGLDNEGRPEMFQERAASVTTLIGHAHSSIGETFIDITRHDNFKHCSKWIFLHTTPDLVETAKSTEERALYKNAELITMAKACDKAFTVGAYMFDYWEDKLDIPTFKFTPELNHDFVEAANPAEASDTIFTMCCVGRVNGVVHSKGFDILKAVLQSLKESSQGVRPHLIIRGIKDQSHQDARDRLGIQKDDVHVSIRRYGTQEDVKADLKGSHLFLMPSIVEPFGLLGLESIASGVVPLMSSETGLAQHIRKYCVNDEQSRCTDAELLIIEHEADEEKRVAAWCERVKQMLEMRHKLPDLAKRIRERLGKVGSTAEWLQDQWSADEILEPHEP
eukprot:m.195621 g.195621  ORF g.195621 m.195621 type:complete len:1090 (-) comp19557_c0_seq1:121-3390(-)